MDIENNTLSEEEINEFKDYIMQNWVYMIWEEDKDVVRKNLMLIISLKDEFDDFIVWQAESLLKKWDENYNKIWKLKNDIKEWIDNSI